MLSYIKKEFMNSTKQKGFAHLGMLLVVIALFAALGGGYLVLTKSKDDSVKSVRVPEVTLSTVANGNPDNTINSIDEQLKTEIQLEEDATLSEQDKAEFDESALSEFEELANENNL